jgi:hypothetical protein
MQAFTVIVWTLSLSVGAWEAANVWRKYGLGLAIYAGVIVFFGAYLWIGLFLPVVFDWTEDIRHKVVGVSTLAGSAAATIFITRKSALAAGVFAGLVVGIPIMILMWMFMFFRGS